MTNYIQSIINVAIEHNVYHYIEPYLVNIESTTDEWEAKLQTDLALQEVVNIAEGIMSSGDKLRYDSYINVVKLIKSVPQPKEPTIDEIIEESHKEYVDTKIAEMFENIKQYIDDKLNQ